MAESNATRAKVKCLNSIAYTLIWFFIHTRSQGQNRKTEIWHCFTNCWNGFWLYNILDVCNLSMFPIATVLTSLYLNKRTLKLLIMSFSFQIPNHVALKIALELKKLLIDNSLLDVYVITSILFLILIFVMSIFFSCFDISYNVNFAALSLIWKLTCLR